MISKEKIVERVCLKVGLHDRLPGKSLCRLGSLLGRRCSSSEESSSLSERMRGGLSIIIVCVREWRAGGRCEGGWWDGGKRPG